MVIKKKLNIIIFSILPITLIVIGILLRKGLGYSFLCSIDPEYSYLFNGLNLANLNFPFHVDHPGTPLQILCAIVIRVVHLFHNNNLSFDADLFSNPEFYISAILYTILLLDAIALFVMAYIIFKKTNNLALSVFFQLTPFISHSILLNLNRIMVEQMFVTTVIVLILTIILYTRNENRSDKLIDKYLIIFSIIIGYGMAIKITFSPLFLIPFIILPGLKKKALYFLFTLASFSLFAFPIFNRWVFYRDWVTNLITHNGPYGSGAETFISPRTYISNLNIILHSDILLSIIYVSIILGCILYNFNFLKIKKKKDLKYKCLVGVSLVIILMIALVSKQFNYFYLTPAFLLLSFGLYLLISIYSRQFRFIRKKIIVIPLFIIFLILISFNDTIKIYTEYLFDHGRSKPYFSTLNRIDKDFKNKPTLIISNEYGSSYKEYGLFFGKSWSGPKMSVFYSPELIKLYPNIYFYHTWNNIFNSWINSFSYIELLKKYQTVILYTGYRVQEESFNSKFHGINRQLDTKMNKVFFNDITGENIYEIRYDTLFSNKNIQYSCNAEKTDSSKVCFISESNLKFGNARTQSAEKHRSGEYSSKLTKENPIGMTSILSEIQKGDHYRISVWVYNTGNRNAGIEISAKETTLYFKFITTTAETISNWNKIEFDLLVTDILNNQDITISCKNNDKEVPAYFDDLLIEKL